MKNELILEKVLEIQEKCCIQSYPINCFEILRQLGFRIIRYSDLSKKKKTACEQLSQDSCLIENTLFYNENQLPRRIRFSVMHELGHHVLCSQLESDANRFASYILAPRMVIHYAKCKNAQDVSNFFDISYEAAEYAFDDYRRWRRLAIYRMTTLDHKIYDHFYDKEADRFVYSIHTCLYCGKSVINAPMSYTCPVCRYRSPAAYDPWKDPLSVEIRLTGYQHQ